MKQLADDVYILEGFPLYAINVYLVGSVLIHWHEVRRP